MDWIETLINGVLLGALYGLLGLGLALVKSIAARHGGSVRCESRSGGGASFVLRLPRL